MHGGAPPAASRPLRPAGFLSKFREQAELNGSQRSLCQPPAHFGLPHASAFPKARSPSLLSMLSLLEFLLYLQNLRRTTGLVFPEVRRKEGGCSLTTL